MFVMSTIWTAVKPVHPAVLVQAGVAVTVFVKQSGNRYRRIEPAASDVVLIIGIGASWRVGPPSRADESLQAFAAGLAMQPREVASEDPAACIEVRLPPPVATDLFGTSLSERDGIVDLVELLGRGSLPLIDRAVNARDPRDVLMDVFHLLAARLCDRPRLSRPEIHWAWRRMASSGGRTSTHMLAQEIGWSDRHFTSRFRDSVGLAPKAAARLARFSRAYRRVAGSGEALALIAADAGYSDQSHMTREFGALAGAAPAEVRRNVHTDALIQRGPLLD